MRAQPLDHYDDLEVKNPAASSSPAPSAKSVSIRKALACAAIFTILLGTRFWPSINFTIVRPAKSVSFGVTFGHGAKKISKLRSITPISAPTGYDTQELVFRLPFTPTTKLDVDLDEAGTELLLVSLKVKSPLQLKKWDTDKLLAAFPDLHNVGSAAPTEVPGTIAPLHAVRITPSGPSPSLTAGSEIQNAIIETRGKFFLFLLALFPLLAVCFAALFRTRSAAPAPFNRGWSLKQERIAVTVITLSLLAVLFRKFIFGDAVYLYADVGMDTYGQYFPILAHWADRWQAHHQLFWPFWSFELAGGTNLGPLLLDPFSLVAVMCGKTLLPFTLAPLAILKFYLIAHAAHAYLSYRVDSPAGRIAGSLWITFCGFTVTWGQHYFYLTFALYVLLLLVGFERFERGKGGGLLVAAGALLGALSVTLLLSTMIFIAVQKGLSRTSARGGLFMLLGVALVGWASIPSAYRLAGNHPPRPAMKPFLEQLVSAPAEALTVPARLLSLDLLGTGDDFGGAFNYYEAPNISCGLLCLICFLSALTLAGPRRSLLPLVIYSAALFSPLARLLLSGVVRTEYRELSFFFVLLIAVPAARGFASLAENGLRPRVAAVFAVLLLTALLAAGKLGLRPEVAIEIALFAAIYVVLTTARIFPVSASARATLLVALTAIEVLVFAERGTNERALVSKKIFSSGSGYTDDTQLALSHLPQQSEPFRVAKLYRSVWFNDGLYQNFSAVEGYFSFLNASYRSFLKAHGVPLRLNERIVKTEDIPRAVLDLLGVKYFLTIASDAAPPDTRPLGSYGAVTVLENLHAAPFVRLYAGDADVKKWKEDLIEMNASTAVPGDAVAAIPYDAGWRLRVDGKPQELLSVQGGLSGFRLAAGEHSIALSYWPRGLTAGIFFSALSFVYCLASLMRKQGRL